MPPRAATTEARYAAIVQTLAARPGVTVGAGRGKGFGAGALATRGKIFTMLSSRGRFVVKLPQVRVGTLVAAGTGTRFEPGPGRTMKEWLEVADASDAWLALAEEALAFVAGQS